MCSWGNVPKSRKLIARRTNLTVRSLSFDKLYTDVFLKSMQHYFGENKNNSDNTSGDLRFKEQNQNQLNK